MFQLDEVNPETAKRFEIAREFQVTMFKKANLRIFLEQWRGKSYTEEQVEAGAPLHALYGVNGLMQIEHKQSVSNPDRTYSNIVSISALPKAMVKIEPLDYKRSDHWAGKKGITHEQAFPPPPEPDEDYPSALEDEDDDGLPF